MILITLLFNGESFIPTDLRCMYYGVVVLIETSAEAKLKKINNTVSPELRCFCNSKA